jgi:hypothetical protein
MKKLIVVTLTFSFSGVAFAETPIVVKSGVETQVGGGWYCSQSGVPDISGMSASHGTLVLKTIPHAAPCLGNDVNGVFYTSQPGYKGSDEIFYAIKYGTKGTVRQRRLLTVE